MTQHDLPQTAAQLALDLHPIGTALTDAHTHLAELSDLTPTRGDARHELNELTRCLNWIHNAYRNADEALTKVAFEIQHAQDVPDPLPLGNEIPALRVIEGGR